MPSESSKKNMVLDMVSRHVCVDKWFEESTAHIHFNMFVDKSPELSVSH